MRRLLVLVFALLLPLQLAWGVAAAYCQHESPTTQSAAHFGHHEHVHHGELKKPAGTKLVIDNDCGACHGSGTAALSVVVSVTDAMQTMERAAASLPLGHPSPPGGPPDRPQWISLA